MVGSFVIYFFEFLLFLNELYASALQEPVQVQLTSGTSVTLTVEYCNWIVFDDENNLVFNMTSRCFCYNNNCDVPGPTLVMYSNTNVSVTIVNKLKGSDHSTTIHNGAHDPDVVNLHTHGLHVDPVADDVMIYINPGQSFTFNYEILSSHYVGTHWYHTHIHGASALQMQGGLHGALLVDTQDKNTWDVNLKNMKEHVLLIQWIWILSSEICNCNLTKFDDFVTFQGQFRITSYCFEWCLMPSSQRTLSGYNYHVDTDYNDEDIFLINSQYQPTIENIQINEFRRLRLINTVSEFYLQISFPIEFCDFYFVAHDGIFFDTSNGKDINRDISKSPYFGQIFMPPGGRADIMFKCNQVGTYSIKTNDSTTRYSMLSKFPRAPGNIQLFSLQIVNNILNNNIVTSLPLSYPAKPDYLTNTLSSNTNILNFQIVNTCSCINYDPSELNFTTSCGFHLDGPPSARLNNLPFDDQITLNYITKNTIYEMELVANFHAFHQHINPMQIMDDELNGFIVQKGDWIDTIGLLKNKFRVLNLHFTGLVMVHCHLLPHADMGMVGYYQIVDNLPQQCLSTISPTNNPTTLPTTLSPTLLSTIKPTSITNNPTGILTNQPSLIPTNLPSRLVTLAPSKSPTFKPTLNPSFNPINSPSFNPINAPSINPSNLPTFNPTNIPSLIPFNTPTIAPSNIPTLSPSFAPTSNPTNSPTYPPIDLSLQDINLTSTETPSISSTSGTTSSPTIISTSNNINNTINTTFISNITSQINTTTPIYQLEDNKKNKWEQNTKNFLNKNWIIVTVVGIVVLFLLALIIGVCCQKRCKSNVNTENNTITDV